MKTLTSNTDLYTYLLVLADSLAGRGLIQLAESVRFAARQGTGLSAEFLGESRIALERVLKEGNEMLHLHEKDELKGILRQLESALRK